MLNVFGNKGVSGLFFLRKHGGEPARLQKVQHFWKSPISEPPNLGQLASAQTGYSWDHCVEHLGSYIPGGGIGAVGCYLGLSSANRAEKLQSPLQAKATRQTFHVSCHERIGKGLRSYRPIVTQFRKCPFNGVDGLGFTLHLGAVAQSCIRGVHTLIQDPATC